MGTERGAVLSEEQSRDTPDYRAEVQALTFFEIDTYVVFANQRSSFQFRICLACLFRGSNGGMNILIGIIRSAR